MKLFLGIDGGGSKTELLLADEAGRVLGRMVGPGANLRRTPPAELRALLRESFLALQESAGLGQLRPAAVCAGFAGAGQLDARGRGRQALAELLPAATVYVVGDMEVALEAAVGPGSGVVLIAGTGSIAYGRNGLNRQGRAGGWGPGNQGGDEGSGYDIARRALRAVRKARTGKGPATLLSEFVAEVFPETTREVQAANGPESAAQLAALFPGILRAARAGDRAAQAILEQAVEALAKLGAEVLRRLDLQGESARVVTCGGIFAESHEVQAGVEKGIRAAAPQALVEPLRTSPAEGAARMAVRLWKQDRAGTPN